jgi:hypothetical protein
LLCAAVPVWDGGGAAFAIRLGLWVLVFRVPPRSIFANSAAELPFDPTGRVVTDLDLVDCVLVGFAACSFRSSGFSVFWANAAACRAAASVNNTRIFTRLSYLQNYLSRHKVFAQISASYLW